MILTYAAVMHIYHKTKLAEWNFRYKQSIQFITNWLLHWFFPENFSKF